MLVPTRVKGEGGYILFSPVRIGLRLCVTYKETSEGNETNQITIRHDGW